MPGFEWIDEEEKNAVTSIFDEGGVLFAHGFDKIRKKYHVREFEKSFCESFDAKYALAVTSGTAAIKIGLKSLGVREGDEVITAAVGFPTTVNPIFQNNLTPVFVDSELGTYNPTAEMIIDAYSENTRAIFLAHTLGNPLEIEKLNPFRWCEKYLNRIPSNYLTSEIYNKTDWIIDTDNFQWRLKRLGDISISIFIIIFSFPLIILCSFLIWLEDRGPIFYSQIRTGVNGKEFKLTKLRTMKDKSEITGPVWATKHDKRITKIGALLRRTRIDELPQLLSVFLGDMSLIGPRPERPEIEIKLKENIPHYELRNLIKPGLSGWAQVNYPYGASIKDSAIKLSYELFYIRNQSFLLDILIFFKTIKLILNMKGSVPKKQ